MNNRYSNQDRHYIYRGIVVYNKDPECKGRVKIFIPGIYPLEYKNKYKMLPWAEPAMSLFGGSWKNEKHPGHDMIKSIVTDSDTSEIVFNMSKQLNRETGCCAVPHAGDDGTDGAQVFVFFEAGDINKPIYFAAAQSGDGWFSEHPNQFVIQTDNIRLRIDEECMIKEYEQFGRAKNKSSCFFTTYNDKCHSTAQVRKVYKTLIDIEALAQDQNAINLQIKGNVNMKIEGDKYEELIGDLYETHIGNKYIRHEGKTFIEKEGAQDILEMGDISREYHGNYEEYMNGDYTRECTGNKYEDKIHSQAEIIYDNNLKYTCNGSYTQNINGFCQITITAPMDFSSNGAVIKHTSTGAEVVEIKPAGVIVSETLKVTGAPTGIGALNTITIVNGIVMGIS